MSKYIKEVLHRLYERRVIIIIAAAYFIITYLTGIGCIVKWFTGVSCAGCGMTRAVLAALQLDFSSAFYYHPLFWLIIPMVIYMMIGKRPYFGGEKREVVISIILFTIIIGVYIYRLFFLDNSPISIDISSSFVVKLSHSLF